MPLPVRYIEAPPNHRGEPSLLEAVSQHKLRALSVQNIATVIRELSSLARHAEGIIGDIVDILGSCHARACVLEERTRRLREDVIPSLDSEQEALDGFEIPHPNFHFRSDRTVDQHPISRHNTPEALLLQIHTASSPAVDLLTPLWADGRNAMNMYSHPGFFFEQWRSSIQKDALRRKSAAHNILSPTRETFSDAKRNGSARLPPAKAGSKSATGLKRSSSLKRSGSFRSRSKSASHPHRHSSLLSLTEVGGAPKHGRSKVASQSLHRAYSVRTRPGEGGATRYSLRRKIKVRPKLLDTLSKTMAAVYTGSDIKLSVTPTTSPPPTATTEDKRDKNEFKRNNFLRRSLSIRRSRSRSRSKSPVPVPVSSTESATNAPLQVRSLEVAQLPSKYTTLSKKHLENLELGSASFETCLDLYSDKKKITTFKFPGSALQSRSGSPLTLPPRSITPRSDPPRVAPKPGRSLTQYSLEYYTPPFQRSTRSATVGTVNPEMRSIIDNVRRKRTQVAGVRPSSLAMEHEFLAPSLQMASKLSSSAISIPNSRSQTKLSTSTLSIPNSQSSIPVLTSFKPIDSLSLSPTTTPRRAVSSPQQSGGNGSVKPRRPAPSKPLVNSSPPLVMPTSVTLNLATPTNQSPILGPAPPRRTDSLSSTQNQNRTKDIPKAESQDVNVSNFQNGISIASSPVYYSSERPQQSHYTSPDRQRKESLATAIGSVITNMNAKRNSAIVKEEAATSSSFRRASFIVSRASETAFDANYALPDALSKLKPKLVKQGSLYVSPRKNSILVSTLGVVNEGDQPRNRLSQILLAGGVNESEVDDERSGLLEAIRKGTQLKKVEQENKQHDELAWDVAAILERYVALHSDGEESDASSFTDEEDWSETLVESGGLS